MDTNIRRTLRGEVERFHEGSRPLPFSILDFWRWSASDVLSNALSEVVTEFLGAHARGYTSGPRAEWDACYLVKPEGLLVSTAEPLDVSQQGDSQSLWRWLSKSRRGSRVTHG